MLTQFDNKLYPNDCEVAEMPLLNQYIFLIQKNASTSLRSHCRKNNLKIYCNQELSQLDTVDVYIRDGKQRFVSGANTFLHYLLRDNPTLDKKTCEWFIKNYLFLNTHYLPQFLWLVNMSRYISDECKIRLHLFEDFNATSLRREPDGVNNATKKFVERILDNSSLELYFYADQILRDLAGSSLRWPELVQHYKNNHKACFDLITSRLLDISKRLNVLP